MRSVVLDRYTTRSSLKVPTCTTSISKTGTCSYSGCHAAVITNSNHCPDRKSDYDPTNWITTYCTFIPTTGVVARGSFDYIANSQLRKLNEREEIAPPEKLKEPIILALPLGKPLS